MHHEVKGVRYLEIHYHQPSFWIRHMMMMKSDVITGTTDNFSYNDIKLYLKTTKLVLVNDSCKANAKNLNVS